jgi:PAS domain S-box-containing protein
MNANNLSKVENTVGIARDIIKQQEIEMELCETQKLFQAITNQDFMGIIITQDGLTRYQNAAATKITGFSFEDRVQWGKDENLSMIYPADRERIIEQFKHDQNDRDADSLKIISYRIVTKSGDVKCVDDYSKQIQFNGKKAWLTMLLDTTEKHHLQENYLKNQKIESVGILAGGIAHDFNNLLTSILGNISLAKIELEHMEHHPLTEILEDAEKAAIRATQLTKQLLIFSKDGLPVKESTAIFPMIKETARFVLRGSNIQLHYKIAPDIPMVYADSCQISQVIQNLVLNAKQAMPLGGKIIISINSILGIKWETKNGIDPARKYVEIIVEDDGPGISLEILSKIFDPYFTTKKSGSGLGLAISYSIVKKHSGMMWVESKLGKGTKIYVVIPVINGISNP